MKLEPRPTFVEAIEGLRKTHMLKWLYLDGAAIWEELNARFAYYIDNIMDSPGLTLLEKKRILQTKNDFRILPQLYKPIFEVDLGSDIRDFLKTCVYVNMKMTMQISTFNVQYHQMSLTFMVFFVE